MSNRAWAYIWGVLMLAGVFSATALSNVSASVPELVAFAVLTTLAIGSQLFEAEHGKQSFYPHFVFFVAGLLTLQPYLFVLLIAVPHLVEWAKERLTGGKHLREWYIQPFNIAVHIIAGMLARWAFQMVGANTSIQPFSAISPVLSASAAIITYVMINHILIGVVLVLARGVSWKQSGILELESLLPDLIMSYLGYVVAILWDLNPWYSLPALSPLVLMYRALMVPQLKQEAQTDGKTGLANATHFTHLFTTEMERAKRFDRPLTVIMADLDLLRNINNTYGHLAGDAVLSGIGRIIRENIREYDIAGRFGGEEFAIVLPETGPADAWVLAERLRAAVETATFEVSTTPTPIGCTMSIGLASCPWDATTLTELIHEADVAVYQAKLRGRNCVVRSSDVPHSVKLQHAPSEERLRSPHTTTFTPRPIPPRVVADAQAQALFITAPLHPDLLANIATKAGPELPVQADLNHRPHEAADMAAGVRSGGEPAIVQIGQTLAENAVVNHHAEAPAPEEEYRAALASHSSNGTGQAHAQQAATIPGSPPVPYEEQSRRYPAWLFNLFVISTIAAGAALTLVSLFYTARFDWTAIALLVALTAGAELMQLDVYGDNTVSVTVALVFAAVLLGGIPGVACVSAAIAAVHYVQQRPVFYKTAVNWSTHVLAGAIPAVVLGKLNVRLDVTEMAVLVVPVIVTALVYFIIETGIIAVAISLSKQIHIVATWRDQFRWLANHYLVLSSMGAFLAIAYTSLQALGLIVFMLPVIMMRYSQKQYVDRTEESMRELKRMNQELTRANHEVVAASKAMEQLNEELFLTLAKIIDARDPYVSGHAAKVSEYATAIAAELHLPPERMEPLRQAGFLHDIGKIGISEQVLHKPGRLTKEEYEYVKSHAHLGGEFLEMCGALRHLAPFVRHHHEWWDGKGYPDGLKGDEIPLEARILAVCDAAEAMASDRPYRRGMSLNEIIEEIKRCSGTQFDPAVAKAFAQVAERERGKLVINSAHEVLRKQVYNGALKPTVVINPSKVEGKESPIPVT